MQKQFVTQLCAVIILMAIVSLSHGQAELASPSTNHPSDHKYSNALTRETSPYLLMHAHNPVNWYGWGKESLGLAKSENKPIFLSIGYSSCHWCHVMEQESFLDDEIAKFLNDNFVCIKVDREERPDIDAIYMESLRVVNRRTSGGWPLSMFLTPDAKPFFGGTYFPARDGDRGVRFGFLTIVKRVRDAWKNQSAEINDKAQLASEQVKKRLSGQTIPADAKISAEWLQRCVTRLETTFDSQFGGFGFAPHAPNRPKFPEPSNLLFLADRVQHNPADTDARKLLVTTCERMMMGGILDHLGGGFHRYSVDRFWKIPHFEKMLYDNAQLASVYSQAFELTGRQDFRIVVEELLEFVNREMKDESGAFYSAIDADSEGEEGKFYRWTRQEIETALSAKETPLFAKVYGIDQSPNFESKYHVPQLSMNFATTAKTMGFEESKLVADLGPIRKKLFDIRSKRARPVTDKKILASWNGMMLRGFADAGRILENDDYIDTAKIAADFILENMMASDGRLVRTYTNGEAKLNAYVPDYACVIDGLLAIHDASNDSKWLDAAIKIQKMQDKLFWDDDQGGYFYTSDDHESLLARAKRINDGPVPSGNSVAAGNLIYLADELNDDSYRKKALRTALAASPLLDQFPLAAPRMLISVRSLNQTQLTK